MTKKASAASSRPTDTGSQLWWAIRGVLPSLRLRSASMRASTSAATDWASTLDRTTRSSAGSVPDAVTLPTLAIRLAGTVSSDLPYLGRPGSAGTPQAVYFFPSATSSSAHLERTSVIVGHVRST